MQTGVFLFRRRTGEHFSNLWPYRDDPFALAFNAAEKAVVATAGVDLHRWPNSRTVEGDPLEWARGVAVDWQVVIIGSGSLVDAFRDADVVDEYRLRVFPTAAGAGRRLFPSGAPLELIGVEQMGPTMLAT